MKRFYAFVFALLLVVSSVAFAVDPPPPLPPLPPALASGVFGTAVTPSVVAGPLPHLKRGSSFDLRFVGVGALVDLLYGDVLRVPHVIDSEVLADTRQVSFQYDEKSGDLREFIKVFLDSMGFAVQSRDGVDFVTRKPADAVKRDFETFVYHPKYRTADYLQKAVNPLLSGHSSVADPVMPVAPAASVVSAAVSSLPASSAAASVPQSAVPRGGISTADDFVFAGSASDVRLLKAVLPELDTAAGEVVVKGWVYEVSDTDARNSAFSIAAHILDGQLGISNGATSNDGTALTFSAHFLSLAISALEADTRFKEVSDPHVRVVSGQRVSLNVGTQVPTLGSISYQGTSGTPVQSVEYQDAGVIFTVQPTVLADSIQVQLDEQISSFVPTTSGVNNSPTKNTRQMTTTVDMKDGEVIVLGGLVQDSDSVSTNHEGWLPHFLDGHSAEKSRTEVLLVLQVQKVDSLRGG